MLQWVDSEVTFFKFHFQQQTKMTTTRAATTIQVQQQHKKDEDTFPAKKDQTH